MRGWLALLFVAGCATARSGGEERAAKPDATLIVSSPVADARVYVDDRFVGRVADLEGRAVQVPSGARRVEVRADGYFTAYRDVQVPPGGAAKLEVQLHKVPEGEPGG